MAKELITMDIKTNHKPRPIIYGFELTDKEREDFDYYDDPEELDSASFFKYRGQVYDLAEFMRIDENSPLAALGYDGQKGDSFFSGTLVKLSDCGEAVTVATYYS